MSKIRIILRIIISLPKTIYFNFRTFNFKTAILFPVYIDYNIAIKETYKGAVILKCSKISPFMIKIGIGGSQAINSRKGIFYLNKKLQGKLIFKGIAKFGIGIVIYNNSGKIEFGNNFSTNKNCFIASDYDIKFGNDVLLGWNINIRDSDGHEIIYDKKNIKDNNIYIGNHVWICSYVDILKGTIIGNDCVIAYRSLVCGLNCDNNNLVAGVPAKIIKRDIDWNK